MTPSHTPNTQPPFGTAPVPVRAAATVMLVRDGADGLEVCMLRRNLKSDFVGGAYVFPGGGVDPADAEAEGLCDGLTDAAASARLNLPAGGLAFWVAAVRESFEEAGLLQARWADGRPVRFDDPQVAKRFAQHRIDVDSGRRRLPDIFAEEGLRFDFSCTHYVSHWVTPPGSPRRYDTRFFIATAPEGQRAVEDDREVIGTSWLRPAAALERQRSGELVMLPPTIDNLTWLAASSTVQAALDAAAAIDHVPAIIPRVLTQLDGSQTIVMPGDERYEDGYAGDGQFDTWQPFQPPRDAR